MYLEGSDVIEQNFELAKDYFTSAIEKNSAAGYSGLGTMYLYGKGVDKDYAKAFRFFNKAAEQGLVEAQYQIGIMYYNGYGVARNFQDAFKYFYLASQAGYVLGYYYLAIMHAEGKLSSPNLFRLSQLMNGLNLFFRPRHSEIVSECC